MDPVRANDQVELAFLSVGECALDDVIPLAERGECRSRSKRETPAGAEQRLVQIRAVDCERWAEARSHGAQIGAHKNASRRIRDRGIGQFDSEFAA